MRSRRTAAVFKPRETSSDCRCVERNDASPTSDGKRACFRQVLSCPSSTSTDGNLTVPTTPGAGKKKNQVKRSRNEHATKIGLKAKKSRTEPTMASDSEDFE